MAMDCVGSPTSSSGMVQPRKTKHKCCKVEGCTVNLYDLGKPYCLKKAICMEHLKAEAVRRRGCGNKLWRFCQQCGKLELLDKFQGHKRSCVASLVKRRMQATDPAQNKEQQQHWPAALYDAACTADSAVVDNDQLYGQMAVAMQQPGPAAAVETGDSSPGLSAAATPFEQLSAAAAATLDNLTAAAVECPQIYRTAAVQRAGETCTAAVAAAAVQCPQIYCTADNGGTAADLSATAMAAAAAVSSGECPVLKNAWCQTHHQQQQLLLQHQRSMTACSTDRTATVAGCDLEISHISDQDLENILVDAINQTIADARKKSAANHSSTAGADLGTSDNAQVTELLYNMEKACDMQDNSLTEKQLQSMICQELQAATLMMQPTLGNQISPTMAQQQQWRQPWQQQLGNNSRPSVMTAGSSSTAAAAAAPVAAAAMPLCFSDHAAPVPAAAAAAAACNDITARMQRLKEQVSEVQQMLLDLEHVQYLRHFAAQQHQQVMPMQAPPMAAAAAAAMCAAYPSAVAQHYGHAGLVSALVYGAEAKLPSSEHPYIMQ